MSMKRVALYIRIANEKYALEALELQEARLTEYAEREGYTVVRKRCDVGWSGTTLDRPGMQALLEDIENGEVDAVLVPSHSHLTRNPLFRNFPCEVISLQEDARMIAESDRVAAIVRERMAQAASDQRGTWK